MKKGEAKNKCTKPIKWMPPFHICRKKSMAQQIVMYVPITVGSRIVIKPKEMAIVKNGNFLSPLIIEIGIVATHIQKNVSRSKKFGKNSIKPAVGKTIAIKYFQSFVEMLIDFILKHFFF